MRYLSEMASITEIIKAIHSNPKTISICYAEAETNSINRIENMTLFAYFKQFTSRLCNYRGLEYQSVNRSIVCVPLYRGIIMYIVGCCCSQVSEVQYCEEVRLLKQWQNKALHTCIVLYCIIVYFNIDIEQLIYGGSVTTLKNKKCI